MNAARKCIVVPLLVLIAGCGSGPTGSACPAALDPRHLSSKQLADVNIASIPRQGATTLTNVRLAERKSSRFIKQNYPDVVEIGIGRGWGVTYSQDDYGNKTFRHGSDHLLVVVVGSRSACPDPERGTLFVFGKGDLRVPVRFLYRNRG